MAEQAHHLSRFEVGDDLDFFTDQFLLIWIELGNSRENLAVLAVTSIQTELEQLVRALHLFDFLDFRHADFNGIKGLKLDGYLFIFELDISWVPLFFFLLGKGRAATHLRLR